MLKDPLGIATPLFQGAFQNGVFSDHVCQFLEPAVSFHADHARVREKIDKGMGVRRFHGVVIDLAEEPEPMGKGYEITIIDPVPVIINLLSPNDLPGKIFVCKAFRILQSQVLCFLNHVGNELLLDLLPKGLQITQAPFQAQIPGPFVLFGGSGKRRDGTGLQHIETPFTVCPLHILRGTEKILSPHGQAEYSGHFRVCQRRTLILCAFQYLQTDPVRHGDHPLISRTRTVRNNGGRVPVQDPPVRFHGPVHQPLIQSVDGLDDGLFRVIWISAEGHARTVSSHDFLDQNRHRACLIVQAQFPTVEKRAI